jgi:threonylcarbamoyladenosine tRNA methylthiotransferase MtaB
MKFAITTLGCKVNQYESQLIREALVQGGYEEQDFFLPGADLYIVNTCTVTHRSDAEDRKLIRKGLSFGARVIVTGCQASVYPDGIREVGDPLEVVPFEEMPGALGVPMPAHITRFSGHSRAFVNVQQGCSNHCTFCIVPRARGVPRSRPMGEVLDEIGHLHQAGFREVILTGINIGLYEGGAARLLEGILEGSPMPRIRISSIEPWTVTEGLMDLIAREPRICRHLHLPLQSGSDAVLARMGRPYQAAYFRELVGRIRAAGPDVAIGSDVMVGFPGEGEEEFRETESFVAGLDIAYLHVFPYSRRPGTPAAEFEGAVDPKVARERACRMRNLSHGKRGAFILSRIGHEEEVIVTHAHGDFFRGVTSNYIKVEAPGEARVNDRVRVMLTDVQDGHAKGMALG